MHLEQYHVAGPQTRRRLIDGCGGADSAVRHRTDNRVRRDTHDADRVDVAAELAQDGRAVVRPVDPGHRRPSHHAALVLHQIFMGETPVALDVDDADVAAASARLRPRPAGIDTAGGGVEIQLSGREVGCGGRRFLRRGGHVVDGGQLDRRFEECRFDQLVRGELLPQFREALRRCVDPVVDGEVLHGRLRYCAVGRQARHDSLLGRPEYWSHAGMVAREQPFEVSYLFSGGRHKSTG